MATDMAICDFLAINWFCLVCDKAGGREDMDTLWPLLNALRSSCNHDPIPGGGGALRIKWDPSWWSCSVKSIVYLELMWQSAKGGGERERDRERATSWHEERRQTTRTKHNFFRFLRLWHDNVFFSHNVSSYLSNKISMKQERTCWEGAMIQRMRCWFCCCFLMVGFIFIDVSSHVVCYVTNKTQSLHQSRTMKH